MTVYLNSNATFPLDASEGSLGEFNPFLKPIITDPSEQYRAEALRLPNGERLYVPVVNKRANWLAADPMFMYWPIDTTGVIPNLGSGLAPNATLVNGAAPSSTELLTGAKSVSFDGTNDFINTGYTTRTNLITKPNFELATVTNPWATQSSAISRDLTTFVSGAASCKVVTLGAAAFEEGIQTGLTGPAVTALSKYAFSIYVKAPAGTKMRIILSYRNSEGVQINTTESGKSLAEFTASGEWERRSLVNLAPAAAVTADAKMTTAKKGTEQGVLTFNVDCALLEQSEEAAFYFPNLIQLAEGLAGWVGTANESASDIGPFARGTSRTFVMAVNRTNHAGSNGLFGSGAAAEGKYWVRASTTDGIELGLKPEPVTSAIWASALPLTTNTILAMTMDPTTGFGLYTNGVLSSNKTVSEARPAATNQNLYIGTARNVWIGKMLPFAVYPRILTAAELLALN